LWDATAFANGLSLMMMNERVSALGWSLCHPSHSDAGAVIEHAATESTTQPSVIKRTSFFIGIGPFPEDIDGALQHGLALPLLADGHAVENGARQKPYARDKAHEDEADAREKEANHWVRP
jgi:hypothetical protein